MNSHPDAILILIIILMMFVLYFYTKGIISSIQFTRKYNIKPCICSDDIISHIVIYTFILANIGICIWVLFNN